MEYVVFIIFRSVSLNSVDEEIIADLDDVVFCGIAVVSADVEFQTSHEMAKGVLVAVQSMKTVAQFVRTACESSLVNGTKR